MVGSLDLPVDAEKPWGAKTRAAFNHLHSDIAGLADIYGVTINHGSDATVARPVTALPVNWHGTVAPNNRATNDQWYDRTEELWKRWSGAAWVAVGSGTYLSQAPGTGLTEGSTKAELDAVDAASAKKASNLSDLASAATARTNLSVQSTAEAAAAYVPGTIVAGTGVDATGATASTAAVQAKLTAAGTGPSVFPPGTYLTGALAALIYSKIAGLGATLKPAANAQSVLTLKKGSTLQSNDYTLVRDLIIEATGKTGITGIDNDGDATASVASMILENVYVGNCDTYAFNLKNAQFVRSYNLRAAIGSGVGMLIANAAVSGGGNSHDHYGTQLVQMDVGLVVNGTRFGGGCHSLNFYNPQVLLNRVCGMAFFDSNFTVVGGAPELNADGATTRVVDGQTVKRSTFHVNNSIGRFQAQHIAEATADPVFLVENKSIVTIEGLSGYGNAGGKLVQCDATSSVHLEGSLAKPVGIIQGISSWPTGWVLHDSAQLIMYGEPIHQEDPTLPVLYSAKSPAITSGGTNPPTMSYVEDADFGFCRQAVFTAFAGSTGSNLAQIAVGSGVASRDNVFSVLVKSSADTTIAIQLHDGANYNVINTTHVVLKAGKVTRLVYGKSNIPAGTWTLSWFPVGADAPTIKFANLQAYQGAAGTQTTSAEISKIVGEGAFNPGPLRATQADLASVAATVNANGSKYPGKQVWDTTNNRVVFAAGRAASDVWKDGVNATVHTPV